MEQLHQIDCGALTPHIFSLFQTQTPLLTAGDKTSLNTMTIGWGGLGTLWAKPVCTVYVRPQRYTYAFMERSACYTVSVLDGAYEEALRLCGSKSGRDTDKVRLCGLTPLFSAEGAPYFAEASLVLVCRKLYADDLRPERFVDASIDGALYPGKDYHRFYVGEVTQVLTRT